MVVGLPLFVAVTCSVGSLVGTYWSAGMPAVMTLVWPFVALRLWLDWQAGRERAVRPVVAVMLAFALTLLGVLCVEFDAPRPSTWQHGPRFGDHPVFHYAGLPWPGVEGSWHACAHDRIPFFMGVDALLLNFTVWLAGASLLMRRLPRARVMPLLLGATASCIVAAGAGGLRLLEYFD